MPSSKRSMNWSNITFTPVSGSPVILNGVTDCRIDLGASLLGFAGDNDRFNTLVVNDFNDPSVMITLADELLIAQIPPNSRGSLSLVHNDAQNGGGVGSGALKFVLAGAVVGGNTFGGAHRQYGSGTLRFMAQSADGQTNPVSVTSL